MARTLIPHSVGRPHSDRTPTNTIERNKFLDQITYEHAPTGNKKSHKPKIYYGSQVDVNPPRFVISVNNSEHFHFSYTRYIENKIREFFGFEGTPIDLELRSRTSIYKNKDKDADRIEDEKAQGEVSFERRQEKKKEHKSKSRKSKK